MFVFTAKNTICNQFYNYMLLYIAINLRILPVVVAPDVHTILNWVDEEANTVPLLLLGRKLPGGLTYTPAVPDRLVTDANAGILPGNVMVIADGVPVLTVVNTN